MDFEDLPQARVASPIDSSFNAFKKPVPMLPPDLHINVPPNPMYEEQPRLEESSSSESSEAHEPLQQPRNEDGQRDAQEGNLDRVVVDLTYDENSYGSYGSGRNKQSLSNDGRSPEVRSAGSGPAAPRPEREQDRITNPYDKFASKHKKHILQHSDIKFGEKVGSGSFGDVFKATVYGLDVAVKRLRVAEDRLKSFLREFRIMKNVRHPNIVEFLGATMESKDSMCIVTEFCSKGSLEDILEKLEREGRTLKTKKVLRWSRDIARGLSWLHHKGIIHRDVKPANLLIDASDRIKIADFGLSHVKRNASGTAGHYGRYGTPCYTAPEVIKNEPYDVKADVFSFGIVLCELVLGRYPYDDAPASTMTFEQSIATGLRPPLPTNCSAEMLDLITRCWAEKPEDRPTVDQITETIYFIEEKEKIDYSVLDDIPDEAAILVAANQQRLAESKTRIEELDRTVRERSQENFRLSRLLRTEQRSRMQLQRKIQRLELANQQLKDKLKLTRVRRNSPRGSNGKNASAEKKSARGNSKGTAGKGASKAAGKAASAGKKATSRGSRSSTEGKKPKAAKRKAAEIVSPFMEDEPTSTVSTGRQTLGQYSRLYYTVRAKPRSSDGKSAVVSTGSGAAPVAAPKPKPKPKPAKKVANKKRSSEGDRAQRVTRSTTRSAEPVVSPPPQPRVEQGMYGRQVGVEAAIKRRRLDPKRTKSPPVKRRSQESTGRKKRGRAAT